MDKAGRRIRAAFEGLHSLLNNPQRIDLQALDTLSPDDFAVTEVACHGFPHQPTCLAYDPVQKLMAIGTQSGAIRILGQPGVNVNLKHNNGASVLQLQFLVNGGAVISLCSDCCVHMWNIRLKRPEIVHSLKYNRERFITMHLPFQSKWLYLGTDKGNVHVLSIETFTLSGYVVNWNKAIDLSQKVHPGIVVHLSECPTDDTKLLIGYECGTLVLWDLKERLTDSRYQCMNKLRSVSWHYDGRQFMCSLANGSLMTWTIRKTQEPAEIVFPLANVECDSLSGQGGGRAASKQFYRPIDRLDWFCQRNGEQLIIFSGGTPFVDIERPPCITVLHGKSLSVLEMEHPIVDFVSLVDTPYVNEEQDCSAIAVLLQNDLVAIDLKAEGCPCFENPYSMDIHDSPVTCCAYLSDCPIDLIRALYAVGSKQKRRGYTAKKWPLTGGVWGSSPSSDPELMVTGHSDGSVKFWDFSSVNLQILYRLRTAKLFEIPDCHVRSDFNFFSITHIALCPASRYLAISGMAGHVIFFKFSRQEDCEDVTVIDVPLFGNPLSTSQTDLLHCDSPGCSQNVGTTSEGESSAESKSPSYRPLKVKEGPVKRSGGYVPGIICLNSWPSVSLPEVVTVIVLNSAYGLLAYGTDQGLVVIDILRKCIVLVMETSSLYGSSDLLIRSPKTNVTSCEKNSMSFDLSENRQSSEKSETGSNRPIGTPEVPPTTKSHPRMMSIKNQPTLNKSKLAYTRDRGTKEPDSVENLDLGIDEGVCSLEFIENISKLDLVNGPMLWVGTTHGSILALSIDLPEPDHRLGSPVTVHTSGFCLPKNSGFILGLGFLDSQCNLLLPPVKFFKELGHESGAAKNRVLRRANTLIGSVEEELSRKIDTGESAIIAPPAGRDSAANEQYVVVCSERATRVISLSTMATLFSVKYDFPFVQACVVTFNAKPLVVGCFSSGRLAAYSVPSLRVLLDIAYFPQNLHCLETVQFGHQGAAVYMCSPTELLKFAISSSFAVESKDILGSIYLPCVTPQPPKQSFFKELFSISSRTLDREELFGGLSRKPVKTISQRNPQSGHGLDAATRKSVAGASEIQRAKMALSERGEKLSDLEDRTTFLTESAKAYADHVQELMLKQKNKKWYQL
uniref:LLGL domain-containing protein n=1 Tax=Trichuris muris TaxID=70415 RepID=A0A5S6QDC9_TRIMR